MNKKIKNRLFLEKRLIFEKNESLNPNFDKTEKAQDAFKKKLDESTSKEINVNEYQEQLKEKLTVDIYDEIYNLLDTLDDNAGEDGKESMRQQALQEFASVLKDTDGNVTREDVKNFIANKFNDITASDTTPSMNELDSVVSDLEKEFQGSIQKAKKSERAQVSMTESIVDTIKNTLGGLDLPIGNEMMSMLIFNIFKFLKDSFGSFVGDAFDDELNKYWIDINKKKIRNFFKKQNLNVPRLPKDDLLLLKSEKEAFDKSEKKEYSIEGYLNLQIQKPGFILLQNALSEAKIKNFPFRISDFTNSALRGFEKLKQEKGKFIKNINAKDNLDEKITLIRKYLEGEKILQDNLDLFKASEIKNDFKDKSISEVISINLKAQKAFDKNQNFTYGESDNQKTCSASYKDVFLKATRQLILQKLGADQTKTTELTIEHDGEELSKIYGPSGQQLPIEKITINDSGDFTFTIEDFDFNRNPAANINEDDLAIVVQGIDNLYWEGKDYDPTNINDNDVKAFFEHTGESSLKETDDKELHAHLSERGEASREFRKAKKKKGLKGLIELKKILEDEDIYKPRGFNASVKNVLEKQSKNLLGAGIDIDNVSVDGETLTIVKLGEFNNIKITHIDSGDSSDGTDADSSADHQVQIQIGDDDKEYKGSLSDLAKTLQKISEIEKDDDKEEKLTKILKEFSKKKTLKK